jgi:hypothetical protein
MIWLWHDAPMSRQLGDEGIGMDMERSCKNTKRSLPNMDASIYILHLLDFRDNIITWDKQILQAAVG